MFNSILIFRISEGWKKPSATAIEEGLSLNRFTECGPTQTESKGWVEPRGEAHGPLLETVGGQMILKLRTQSRALPASVVKEEVEKRCKVIAEQIGRKVGRTQKLEIKDEVTLEFLPRAFVKTATTLVWIDPEARFLVIGAGSYKKADVVATAVIEAISAASDGAQGAEGLVLTPIHTQISPGKAMSGWLHSQEAPAGFSVDRECELKSTEGEGATVRYTKHTLDIVEVVKHIENGKEATKLAMTFGGRVSFVLGADMGIKKIDFLDVSASESKAAGDKGADHFDADVAIATGELGKLIPEIIDALGGETVPGLGGGEFAPVVKISTPEIFDAARAMDPLAELSVGSAAPW